MNNVNFSPLSVDPEPQRPFTCLEKENLLSAIFQGIDSGEPLDLGSMDERFKVLSPELLIQSESLRIEVFLDKLMQQPSVAASLRGLDRSISSEGQTLESFRSRCLGLREKIIFNLAVCLNETDLKQLQNRFESGDYPLFFKRIFEVVAVEKTSFDCESLEGFHRDGALDELARSYMKVGELDKAAKRALEVNARNQNTLLALATAYIAAARFQMAARVADEMDDYYRVCAYESLAKTLVEGGYGKSIDQLVEGISHSPLKDAVLKTLSWELIRLGKIEQAKAFLEQIKDTEIRNDAYFSFVQRLNGAQKCTKAVKLVRRINKGDLRRRALESISEALASSGRFVKAIRVAKKLEYPLDSHAFSAIAKKMVASDPDGAVRLALRAKCDHHRDDALREIALAVAGRDVNLASTIARRIKTLEVRSQAFRGLYSLVALGSFTSVVEWFSRLEAQEKQYVLCDMCKSVLFRGDLEDAVTLAQSITDLRARKEAFEAICLRLSEMGMTTRALSYVDQIDYVEGAVNAFSLLCRGLVRMGEYKWALEQMQRKNCSSESYIDWVFDSLISDPQKAVQLINHIALLRTRNDVASYIFEALIKSTEGLNKAIGLVDSVPEGARALVFLKLKELGRLSEAHEVAKKFSPEYAAIFCG